jgi:hypothetical protein
MEIYLVLEHCDEQTFVHSGWTEEQDADYWADELNMAATNNDGDFYSCYVVQPLKLGVTPSFLPDCPPDRCSGVG